jgi:hypothetical protein
MTAPCSAAAGPVQSTLRPHPAVLAVPQARLPAGTAGCPFCHLQGGFHDKDIHAAVVILSDKTRHARNFRTREVFESLCRGQDWRCYYCGTAIHICDHPKLPGQQRMLCWNAATRDHVIPRSRGGGDGSNLVAACWSCNNAKGDQ